MFGAPVHGALLHQAVVRELNGRRAGTHDTKGRSEVSGGGKKPWKQKGTGRARQGSIRATQWKGGGKPFGPTPRSYAQAMPRQARRGALRAAWTDKVAGGQLTVVERLELAQPKTKALVGLLAGLGVTETRTLLVVVEPSAGAGARVPERAVADARAPGARVGGRAPAARPGRGGAPGPGRDAGRAPGMRDPRQVVLRPLVTEKATTLKDERNQVSFQVAMDANKVDIRRAVETIFKVKVTDVRTQVVFGKEKRMGRFVGRRASWKKAVVQLAPDNKIELFES